MKKHLYALLAAGILAGSANAQITLSDAYDGIAAIPAVKCTNCADSPVACKAHLNNTKCAVAKDYKGAQDIRTEMIYTIESLPIRNMLVGVNNADEMAYVFAEPIGNGVFNVLVIEADDVNGNYDCTYGTTDQSGVDALAASSLTIGPGYVAINE